MLVGLSFNFSYISGILVYGVVVSTSVFTGAIGVRIPAGAVKFDIVNLRQSALRQ